MIMIIFHTSLPPTFFFFFASEQVVLAQLGSWKELLFFKHSFCLPRIEDLLFCHISTHLSACNRWLKWRTSKIPVRKLSCTSPSTAWIQPDFRKFLCHLPAHHTKWKRRKILHLHYKLEAISSKDGYWIHRCWLHRVSWEEDRPGFESWSCWFSVA